MGERFGPCRQCNGAHCLSCDGTGFTGNAMVYFEAQQQEEWKREERQCFGYGKKVLVQSAFKTRLETEFYKNAPQTKAIALAVQAFHIALQRQRKGRINNPMKFKEENLGGTGLSQNFIKLKDKETVQGVFRGEIYDFKQHWTKGPAGDRSEICIGQGCMTCPTKKPSFRFRLNFVVKNGAGIYEPKIFEQGWSVYETLRSMAKSGYDLEKTVVNITRNGSGRHDTTYSILPIPGPKAYISEERDQHFKTLKLHDLQNLEEQKDSMETADPLAHPPEDGDIPF